MLCMSHPNDSHVFAKGIVIDFDFHSSSSFIPSYLSRAFYLLFFSFSIFAKAAILNLAQELILQLENLFGVELFGISLGSLLGIKSPQATGLVLVAI